MKQKTWYDVTKWTIPETHLQAKPLAVAVKGRIIDESSQRIQNFLQKRSLGEFCLEHGAVFSGDYVRLFICLFDLSFSSIFLSSKSICKLSLSATTCCRATAQPIHYTLIHSKSKHRPKRNNWENSVGYGFEWNNEPRNIFLFQT